VGTAASTSEWDTAQQSTEPLSRQQPHAKVRDCAGKGLDGWSNMPWGGMGLSFSTACADPVQRQGMLLVQAHVRAASVRQGMLMW